MLRILVAHSWFLQLDHKQQEKAKPYPPLATLHVAAILRRAGHEVRVFDAMLSEGVAEFAAQLPAARPDLVLFYEDSFNFLSKMCLARMRDACLQMLGMARRARARVIVVGSDATDAPESYLRAGAEIVVLGEGLVSLCSLVAKLAGEPALPLAQWIDGQYGYAVLQQGQVQVVNGARPLPNPLYGDPPAWELIDLEGYRRIWRDAHGYFSLNMAASRGCSFRCNWCAKPIWGNQYLQRNARDVAAEMAFLKRSYAPDHIWFADDIFGFRVDWVREFAATVHACDGALPFTIQTRADLISVEMAEALRAAGCMEVWLGAESGSQRVLDAMNKGTTVAEIFAARSRLRAVSIRTGFFIQLGYLHEDLDDILATRALVEQARPDDIGVSVSYPLPGTRFYEQVKQQLGNKTHWEESNDLEMMFHGTYKSDFYRAVRDLLHDEVAGRADTARRWEALLSRQGDYRNGRAPRLGVG
jgi:anaerobic magnesium-protoporphyrin IX monomethyl ester cyclase